MYPRTNYEMTEEDLKVILDACRPTPVMKIGNYLGSSPQENANRAWRALGEKMGFDHMTVRPNGGYDGKGERFFSAVPSETKEQKRERLEREAKIERRLKIVKLKEEIAERQEKLDCLIKS